MAVTVQVQHATVVIVADHEPAARVEVRVVTVSYQVREVRLVHPPDERPVG